MTKSSGFISTYKGADQYLSDIEKKASSFTEEELAVCNSSAPRPTT